jgi:hypothetical protein
VKLVLIHLGNKKLSKAVSTKLTDEDYELCRRMAREYYISGKIEYPSVSELIRLLILRILDSYRSRTNAPNAPLDGQHTKSFRFKRPS